MNVGQPIGFADHTLTVHDTTPNRDSRRLDDFLRNQDQKMFQGRFEHNLDDKGRMAIPAPFRKQLADDAEQSAGVVVTISDQCLVAYPPATWQAKVEQISRLNQLDPKVTAFKRLIIGCAQDCPVDKAGRILVPQDLRRDAQIDREAVVVGQIDKFEIWSASRWQDSFAAMSDQVGAIFASLADQGVQL